MRNRSIVMLPAAFAVLTLFVLMAHADTKQMDGQTDDWRGNGTEGKLVVDKNEAIWVDYIDDDKGDGDYTYPKWAGSPTWGAGTAYDIEEARIAGDGKYLYFLVRAGGPHLVTLGVFIDAVPGGQKDIFFRGGDPPIDPFAQPHIKLASPLAWDVAALIGQSGGGQGHRNLLNITFDGGKSFGVIKEWAEFGACCGDATEDLFYQPENPVIELRLPIESAAGVGDGVPDPAGQTFHFMILMGLGQVNVPPKGIVAFGRVQAVSADWEPGGADNPNAPFVFDMIGSTPDQQIDDLSGYTATDVTTLRYSVVSIAFDRNGEPDKPGTLSVDPAGKLPIRWATIKSGR